MLLILMVMLILGVVGTAAYFLCRVKNIEVSGNARYSREQIIALSGLQMGDSIFTVKNAEVKALIMKEPYIKSAAIEEHFPDTISIAVTEKTAAAMILYLNSFVILDEEGYILEITNNVVQEFCPTVSGMNVSSFQVGEKIKSADSGQEEAYSLLIAKLKESKTIGIISEINLSNVRNIFMISRDSIKIRLGNLEEIDKKLQWVSNIMPILFDEGKKGGTLDVSNPAQGSYIP